MSRTRERTPELDFSQRASLSEWMDEPCSYDQLRGCLRDLSSVNRVLLAYRPTLHWLQEMCRPGAPPVHIVDVGSGGGDTLRTIERWAVRKKIAVKLTGVDLHPYAVRVARECTPPESHIRWMEGNAYQLDHLAEPIDFVISSMLTHHLEDDEIARFLTWMEAVTTRGWFISDLHRERRNYQIFRVLAKCAHWHPFIQNDGPISVRRAFQPADWQRYIGAAGLKGLGIRVATFRPGRLTVARNKQV